MKSPEYQRNISITLALIFLLLLSGYAAESYLAKQLDINLLPQISIPDIGYQKQIRDGSEVTANDFLESDPDFKLKITSPLVLEKVDIAAINKLREEAEELNTNIITHVRIAKPGETIGVGVSFEKSAEKTIITENIVTNPGSARDIGLTFTATTEWALDYLKGKNGEIDNNYDREKAANDILSKATSIQPALKFGEAD